MALLSPTYTTPPLEQYNLGDQPSAQPAASTNPLASPTLQPPAGVANNPNPFDQSQQGYGYQQGPGQINFTNKQPTDPTTPAAPGANPYINPALAAAQKARTDKAAAGQAVYTAAPDWMKNLLTGVDTFGGTNQTRADWSLANKAGNSYQNGGNNTDWQSWVTKVSGMKDPWEAMRQLALTSRVAPGAGGSQGAADVRRAMEASGIDPGVAARVSEMFFLAGGDAMSAAQRLGVQDEYNRRGGMQMHTNTYDPTKYAGTTLTPGVTKNLQDVWQTAAPTGTTDRRDTTGTGAPTDLRTTTPANTPAPTVGGPKGSMADMTKLFQDAGITNYDARTTQDALNQGAKPEDILNWWKAKNAGTLTPDTAGPQQAALNQFRNSTFQPPMKDYNGNISGGVGADGVQIDNPISADSYLNAAKSFDPNAHYAENGVLVYDKTKIPQQTWDSSNFSLVQSGHNLSGQDINDPSQVIHDPTYGDFVRNDKFGLNPGDSTSGFMAQLGKYAPAAIATVMSMGMGAAAGPLLGAILSGTIGPGGLAEKVMSGQPIDWKSVLTNAAISVATGAAGAGASKLLGDAGMSDLMKYINTAKQGYGMYQTIEQIRGG